MHGNTSITVQLHGSHATRLGGLQAVGYGSNKPKQMMRMVCQTWPVLLAAAWRCMWPV